MIIESLVTVNAVRSHSVMGNPLIYGLILMINVNETKSSCYAFLTNVHGRNCGYGASAPSNGIDVGYSAVTHVLKCQRGWNGSKILAI